MENSGGTSFYSTCYFFESTIHWKNSTPRHGECWAAKQVQAFPKKTAI
jgi:hypothetical protein